MKRNSEITAAHRARTSRGGAGLPPAYTLAEFGRKIYVAPRHLSALMSRTPETEKPPIMVPPCNSCVSGNRSPRFSLPDLEKWYKERKHG